MGAINFTGLRKKTGNAVELNPSVGVSPAVHKKPEPTITQPENKKPKASEPLINPNDSLLESKYCYGCLRFSVDAPDTPQERGWCMRDDANGGYAFFAIKKAHKVKQCPVYKKRIKRGVNNNG